MYSKFIKLVVLLTLLVCCGFAGRVLYSCFTNRAIQGKDPRHTFPFATLWAMFSTLLQVLRGREGVGDWGKVLPFTGYIGICGPKGYGFSAVLIFNREWSLYRALIWVCFFFFFLNREATFSSLSNRKSTKPFTTYV